MSTDPTLIKMSQHVAILNDPTDKGRYYYKNSFGGDRPWITIDKSGPTLRSEQCATEEEAIAFFGASPAPQATIPEPVEAPQDGFVLPSGVGFRKVSAEPTEGVSEPNPVPVPATEEQRAEMGLEPDHAVAAYVAPPTEPEPVVEDEPNPYADLSDEDLRYDIEKAERAWFEPYRKFANADARLTALQASFDTLNAALIAEKKSAKEAKELAAVELKAIAAEYFRRNPDEKKFDVYVSAKEFQTVELDEPLAIKWAQENYPAAVQTERITLDHKRVADYVKDCVKRKEPIPPFAKFKYNTEVQLSTKVPVPDSD